jgi:hypothetical protein
MTPVGVLKIKLRFEGTCNLSGMLKKDTCSIYKDKFKIKSIVMMQEL